MAILFGCNLQQIIASTDTLRVDLPTADKMFLDSNLLVLAQKYNIDAQRALVIQAKVYPNPNISWARGPIIPLHDPTSSIPNSSFTNNAETQAQLSQLILLAGKRNKQIKIAAANVTLAEYQFFDLLRTLKYTLHSDFYNIYYLQQSAKVYDQEIKALQQIVNGFNSQQQKGYISEKEVVRIKAQLYSFQSEYNQLISQIKDIEGELKLIVQIKSKTYLVPIVDTAKVAKLDPLQYPLSALLDSAYRNRTDLLIAKENTEINQLTYNYQKALAIPDLTLSIGYDHQGSYAMDFNYAGLAIDLPFFNRNQGNIKNAKIMVDNTLALQKSAIAQVDENVNRSLEKAILNNQLAKQIDTKFSSDFERLMHEVLLSYQKRNSSILDFLDFYDAYKQNALQVNSILYTKVQSFEDLNYYTATNFFK